MNAARREGGELSKIASESKRSRAGMVTAWGRVRQRKVVITLQLCSSMGRIPNPLSEKLEPKIYEQFITSPRYSVPNPC